MITTYFLKKLIKFINPNNPLRYNSFSAHLIFILLSVSEPLVLLVKQVKEKNERVTRLY